MYRFIIPLLSAILSAGAILTNGAATAEFSPLAVGFQYRITVAGNWDGASVSPEIWNETLVDYSPTPLPPSQLPGLLKTSGPPAGNSA